MKLRKIGETALRVMRAHIVMSDEVQIYEFPIPMFHEEIVRTWCQKCLKSLEDIF